MRYALLGDSCSAASGNERTGCLPVVAWARAHGVDVSAAAGQPHRGALYALTRRAVAAAGCGRTPRSATSRRTVPVAAGSVGRRASRAPGRRGARARRASRRCSRRHAISVTPGAGRSRSAFPGSRRCAATAPASARRCRRSRAASHRRARPGRRCRGSRARAAGDRAGTAAASGSRRRPRRRPPGARTARSQPRGHAPAVRHAGDEDARGVDAGGRLELIERALERLDVVGAGGLAADVPERVRSAGRRIGDEEALAIGQPAEAGVACELVARLAGAVQGDHERPRLVRAARRVQEDLALSFGRVEGERVVARRQRGAWLVRRVRRVVDRLGAGLPRHHGEEGETGEEGGGRPRPAGGHAGTARAKTQPRHSAKLSRVTGGRTASSPASRGRCSSPTAIARRAASSPEPSERDGGVARRGARRRARRRGTSTRG